MKAANLTPPVHEMHPFWHWIKADCELEMAAYDLMERAARDKAKEFPDAPYA